MRLLFLTWPHLPLRLERERLDRSRERTTDPANAQGDPSGLLHPSFSSVSPHDHPIVLGGRPWEAGAVVDCSPAARRHGVRRGMPLGAAHKLAPEAAFLAPHPEEYRAAVEMALEALSAFTPSVEGESDPRAEGFGDVLLGIEGLERLWGDEATLLGRIAAALGPLLPGPPRAGIGGSRFAARAAAIVAQERLPETGIAWLALPPGGTAAEAAFLAPLPIALLPASAEAADRFRLFGLRRIGDLARLARSAVVARFGEEGGFLHDLASGLDGRRLVPRRVPERLRAEAELDPPVELLEPLRFVLHRLADVLCAQVAARGAGAGAATLELTLDGAALPFTIRQDLPGPTATAEPVERLLLSRLEMSPPPAPVGRMALELDRVGPAAARQIGLFVPQAAREARLDWQLADLAIRFGSAHILRASLRDPDAWLPEDRFAWAPATGGAP